MLSVSASYAEALFLPLDEQDRELVKYIYSRKYGRKLPANFYIPGIDVSEPFYYIACSIFTIYVGIILIVFSSVCLCQFPIFTIIVEAQNKILCRYVKMIGTVQRNAGGDVIRYTNIQNDQYVLDTRESDTYPISHNVMFGRKVLTTPKEAMNYDEAFTRQIFHFHQKLTSFREDASIYFSKYIYFIFKNFELRTHIMSCTKIQQY